MPPPLNEPDHQRYVDQQEADRDECGSAVLARADDDSEHEQQEQREKGVAAGVLQIHVSSYSVTYSASSRSRSSSVSRRTISRACPSRTATTGGRGTWL